MRKTIAAAAFAAVLGLACGSRAELADPKTLYTLEGSATAQVKLGESGTLKLAVKPKKDAYVKAETPFKAKLSGTGVELAKTELAYKDGKAENNGPTFEVPFKATAAGAGQVEADLTFFVCIAEACLRTTEKVSYPVTVAAN